MSLKLKLFLLLLLASPTYARETLTNAAVFMRCYSQLTQSRPAPNDPLLRQVVAGTKSPVDACMQVFDQGRLSGSGTLSPTNEVGKKVLKTMQSVHASWFSQRDFTNIGIDNILMNQDLYDTETPAFYYTRAMFQPNVKFNYVVKSDKHLRALRTVNDPPKGVASGRVRGTYIFDSVMKLAPVGELLGLQETGVLASAYDYTIGTIRRAGTVRLGAHFGGGVLGSQPYLLMNVLEDKTFRSNGGESMPRKWARSVYSDLLCRQLPVVRYADVASFRVPASSVPFRQTQGCVQCHASMDRMAASIRDFQYMNIGNRAELKWGGGFANFLAGNGQSGTAWPSEPDATYSQKNPDGVLYFRNYKGALRNVAFQGPAQLGALLADEEDLYVCAAKRYYAYFIGVDVTMGDPVGVPTLSTEEATQKRHVEDLGKFLKSDADQSVRDLIRKIFELPEYRHSDFSP